jgi:hypothetical protein
MTEEKGGNGRRVDMIPRHVRRKKGEGKDEWKKERGKLMKP